MRKSISALAVGMLLLSGALIAGCGGGGDSTTSGGGTVASKGAEQKEAEGSPGSGGGATGGEADAGESVGGGGSASGRGSAGGGERRGRESPPASGAPSGGKSQGGSASSGDQEASSDGEAEGGAPAPKVKARFVTKANALCDRRRKKMQAQVRVILEGAKGAGSQEAILKQMLDKAVGPGMEAEADELRKLKAPPGDEAKVRAIAAKIDATIAEVRRELKVLLRTTNVFSDAQKAARAYGIPKCARAS